MMRERSCQFGNGRIDLFPASPSCSPHLAPLHPSCSSFAMRLNCTVRLVLRTCMMYNGNGYQRTGARTRIEAWLDEDYARRLSSPIECAFVFCVFHFSVLIGYGVSTFNNRGVAGQQQRSWLVKWAKKQTT
jgi:hypothetical protein